MTKRIIAAVAAALVIAAAAVAVILTHQSPSKCSGETTMQCVLKTQPAPPKTYSVTPGSRYGVDFGWSGVSASYAKSIGAQFGASYLSPDGSKNWTRSAVNDYHAAGLGTVAVWESTATRAEQGYSAGVADAQAARSQAAALGNTSRPIDFAVDCSCSGAQVAGYFEGVHAVIPHRDDAYGDYDVIAYLHSHGLVGNDNWQTYAWSGGRWLPSSYAPLEQYLNGASFDNDRALRADYGQWPYTAAKPKPKPQTLDQKLSLSRLDATVRHFGKDHAQERNTVRTYVRAHCERSLVKGKRTGRYVRKACVSSAAHLNKLHERLVSLHKHGRAWSKPKNPSASGPRNQVLWHLYLGHRRNWTSWREMVKG